LSQTASVGQQLLVDHLVQHAAEQVGRGVERLALADQALGDGLALDVGGPDGLAVDMRATAVSPAWGGFSLPSGRPQAARARATVRAAITPQTPVRCGLHGGQFSTGASMQRS
jgi:hypothetical protein